MTSLDLPGSPEEEPGEASLPSPEGSSDFATRRLDPGQIFDTAPGAQEAGQTESEPDLSTRRIEPDQLFGETPRPQDTSSSGQEPDLSTRRIDPDQLFSALEPEPDLPGPGFEDPLPPTSGPTQFIDEPPSIAAGAGAFSLPDTPSPVEEAQPVYEPSLPPVPPPAPESTPPSSGVARMQLPPSTPTPAAPRKSDNTVLIVAIVGIVLVAVCMICACMISIPILGGLISGM